MKFTTTTILSALLYTEAALAGVAADRRAERIARRIAKREGHGQRGSPLRIVGDEHATVQSNWGGAILSGSGFTAVSATVNVPEGGGGSSAAGSAWVGIDGDTCQTAILQTGFDWYGDGTFDAWYEWYPEDADDFSLTVSEGDSIHMSVVATSHTSGSATLENLTTGKTVTKTFTGQTSGSLCGTTAEYIIEDFEECEGNSCTPVPFASFSPAVVFSSTSATANGKSVALSGAEITEVEINNKDVTKCSISGTSLTCSYV